MTAPGVYTPRQGQDKPRQGAKQFLELPEVGSEAERVLVERIARAMCRAAHATFGDPEDWRYWVADATAALAALREMEGE